jgi:hypothetical protein
MAIKLFVPSFVLILSVYTGYQHANSVLYESGLSLIQSHVTAGDASSIRLDVDLGLGLITIG